MNLALAFQRSDLFIPGFFSGIFSEMDYENAQRAATSRNTPVSLFTHTPYLVEPIHDPYFLQLVPFTIVAARSDGELLVHAYQHNEKHTNPHLRGRWSIGIDSYPDQLPTGYLGLLDVLVDSAKKALFSRLGLDTDIETLHRCLSYSSFIVDKSNDFTKTHLPLAHRINLSSIPRLTPDEKTGVRNSRWLDGETLQQMREDGLMDVWSEMLLEEEFV